MKCWYSNLASHAIKLSTFCTTVCRVCATGVVLLVLCYWCCATGVVLLVLCYWCSATGVVLLVLCCWCCATGVVLLV